MSNSVDASRNSRRKCSWLALRHIVGHVLCPYTWYFGRLCHLKRHTNIKCQRNILQKKKKILALILINMNLWDELYKIFWARYISSRSRTKPDEIHNFKGILGAFEYLKNIFTDTFSFKYLYLFVFKISR